MNFLQTLESRDRSELIIICWCGAQETFHIIINVETDVLSFLFNFVGSKLINKKLNYECKVQKNSIFSQVEIFCNIINVLTFVTFDQFNAMKTNIICFCLKNKIKILCLKF